MLEKAKERVLVTGASGMIGQVVVRHLLARGHPVRALVSRAMHHALPEGAVVVAGDMRDRESLLRATADIDVVIHLAARKSDEEGSEAVNVDGARNLADACRERGVPLLLNISTQSVKLQKKGVYADTKMRADAIFASCGVPTVTLLPSVVYSDLESGILGSIQRFLKLPVVPLIGDGTATFRPILADDLAEILERCMHRHEGAGQRYDVGGKEEISMNALVDLLQAHRGSRKPVLHLPLWLAMFIARMLRWMKHPPVTVSNVLGASETIPVNIDPIVALTGVTPRGIHEGLRTLLQDKEAATLLSYIANVEATKAMIERFRKALVVHGVEDVHVLNGSVLAHRWLLQSLDATSRIRYPSCQLQRKLLIAAAIAECSPESADALLPKDRIQILIILESFWILLQASISLLIGCVIAVLLPSFFRRNAGL